MPKKSQKYTRLPNDREKDVKKISSQSKKEDETLSIDKIEEYCKKNKLSHLLQELEKIKAKDPASYETYVAKIQEEYVNEISSGIISVINQINTLDEENCEMVWPGQLFLFNELISGFTLIKQLNLSLSQATVDSIVTKLKLEKFHFDNSVNLLNKDPRSIKGIGDFIDFINTSVKFKKIDTNRDSVYSLFHTVLLCRTDVVDKTYLDELCECRSSSFAKEIKSRPCFFMKQLFLLDLGKKEDKRLFKSVINSNPLLLLQKLAYLPKDFLDEKAADSCNKITLLMDRRVEKLRPELNKTSKIGNFFRENFFGKDIPRKKRRYQALIDLMPSVGNAQNNVSELAIPKFPNELKEYNSDKIILQVMKNRDSFKSMRVTI